jgi:hypothetical protein
MVRLPDMAPGRFALILARGSEEQEMAFSKRLAELALASVMSRIKIVMSSASLAAERRPGSSSNDTYRHIACLPSRSPFGIA